MGTINLFGASGHAKVVMDIIAAQGDRVSCLYDDDPHCSEIHGKPMLKAGQIAVEGKLIISIIIVNHNMQNHNMLRVGLCHIIAWLHKDRNYAA